MKILLHNNIITSFIHTNIKYYVQKKKIYVFKRQYI